MVGVIQEIKSDETAAFEEMCRSLYSSWFFMAAVTAAMR